MRVSDITIADRAERVLASRALEVPPGAGSVVVVEVPADRIDPRSSYGAFAHIDTTRSGLIQTGHYISPAIHPVLTQGSPDEIYVDLTRVGPRFFNAVDVLTD